MKSLEFKQQGVVLLLLLLVFLVAGSSMMFATLNNRQDLYLRQQAELSIQMQLAKDALLAFAANSSTIYGDRGPGFFPCPDTTGAGTPDDECNSGLMNLGRLPEHVDVDVDVGGNKIFLNSYYAGVNQQFWYAVAPNYTYSTDADKRKAVNRTSAEHTSSRLVLDNTDNVVALIIAPGEALGSQDRNAGPLAASNFLEPGNYDTDLEFFTASAAGPAAFNDRVIAITHDELMTYITANVALKIKRLLDDYYDSQSESKSYPGTQDAPPADYQDDFADLLNELSWLGDDNTTANYEQWSATINYLLNSVTEASIEFEGYTGTCFRLKYDAEITRDRDSC